MGTGKAPVWFAAAGIPCCNECGYVFALTGARRLSGYAMRYPKGTDRRCPCCQSRRTSEGSTLLLGVEDLPHRLQVCRLRVKRYGRDTSQWPCSSSRPDRDTGLWRRLNEAISVDW